VTCVELDEGPRLLTNVVDSDAGARLALDAACGSKYSLKMKLALARFRLADAGDDRGHASA